METTMDTRNRVSAKATGLWVLKIAIAGLFFMAGGSKVTGAEQMVQLFNTIGVGQWFRYVTGFIELTGAVLILMPALASFGALLLIGTMVGAILTHLFVIGGSPAMPTALLLGSLIVLYSSRQQLLKFIRR